MFFLITKPTNPLLKNDTHTSQELIAITDFHVDSTLRSADAQQGKWLAEDPSLTQIQQMLMSR